MRLPQRLTTIAVIACCLALTAAGCGDEPDAEPKPSTSLSTTKPAESNAATVPGKSTVPSEMVSENPASSVKSNAIKPVRGDFPTIDADDENGATADFEYFVTAYHYSLLSGDISAMKDASAINCSSCNSMMAKAEAGKGRAAEAEWILGDIHFAKRSKTCVDAMMHVNSDSISANTGKRSMRKFDIGAAMEWKLDRWVATDAAVELATK